MGQTPKIGRPPRKSGESSRIEIRATTAERARWRAAAAQRGVSLSELVRSLLDAAAKR